MPHWGQNTPVAVRDRFFVLCEEGWKSDAPLLVCLDVKDGKILWQQTVDHIDAWPADKAKVAKETRAKQLRYWREFMAWWNKLYWDNEKNTWKGGDDSKDKSAEAISPEQTALIAEAAKAGFNLPPKWTKGVSGGGARPLLWEIRHEGDAADPRGLRQQPVPLVSRLDLGRQFFGSCMGSVVSDGNRIYAVTALDGAACFDLDGKRLWVADLEGKQIANFPASASRVHNHMAPGGTPVVMVLGTTPVVISRHGMVPHRRWEVPGPGRVSGGIGQDLQIRWRRYGGERAGKGLGLRQ